MDNGLNTLRAVLVGLAFVAAVFLAFNGAWLATGVLTVAILAHGALWLYLWRQKQRDEGRAHPSV